MSDPICSAVANPTRLQEDGTNLITACHLLTDILFLARPVWLAFLWLFVAEVPVGFYSVKKHNTVVPRIEQVVSHDARSQVRVSRQCSSRCSSGGAGATTGHFVRIVA